LICASDQVLMESICGGFFDSLIEAIQSVLPRPKVKPSAHPATIHYAFRILAELFRRGLITLTSEWDTLLCGWVDILNKNVDCVLMEGLSSLFLSLMVADSSLYDAVGTRVK